MQIKFSDEDRATALEQVKMREIPKRIRKINNQKICTKKDETVDYFGVLAEIALAKIFNVKLPLRNLLSGDEGWDLKVNGDKIEVKYTFYRNGRLLVRDKSKIKADYFFLLTGDDKSMEIAGWIDKETFLRKGYFKDLGYGTNFVMDQNQLYPFNKWKD
jgi:hypothetical protein